ncbi:DUF6525 family protein [Roseovarius sp. S1116L3]|uniref:DUF6525 family protein n=1 Tax=Roseovarius roseus TaxID=3342636 RepID=UPI003729F1E0
MSRNLSSTLRRRRRADPMQTYDTLPRPLRAWLSQASLPWSPASCRRIWQKAQAEGAPPEAILDRLNRGWLGDLFRLDFETSLVTGQPVIAEIGHQLGATLALAAAAMLLSLVIGLP